MKPHSFRLSQLCETVGGELIGEDIEISGAAGIDEATDTDITFLRQNRPIEALENCEAGAVCIAPGHADPGRPAIRHANPRYVFGMALPLLVPSDTPDAGVHATALVHESATLGEGVCIGAYAIVESDAVVGDRTVISAHAVIERRADIGNDCHIHSRAIVHHDCRVGHRSTLFAGAVVGCDGFGFEVHEDRIHRIHHIGTVELGCEVEVGANSVIDRGTTGVTRIGDGTKIDNLVMIAHNCEIGRSCMIASLSGIAGSTKVGDGVIMGGSTRIKDHAHVGDGVMLGGGAGVWKDVPAGAVYSGYPARDHKQEVREVFALRKLPDLLREFRALKRQVERLEEEST